MADPCAPLKPKSSKPRPLSRKCRDGDRNKSYFPPKVTIAHVQWLQRPLVPTSPCERSLVKSAPAPTTPTKGKTLPCVPLPSVTDPPSLPPKSNGHAWDHAGHVTIAEQEEADHITARDQATVAAGQSAWIRLKKDTARLHDHKLVGDALLVGRKVCMQAVGADKPRGIRYVKANSAWLKQHGFDEITRSTRQCAMLVAENWPELQAWMKTLPPSRRTEINHPVTAWRAYVTRNRKLASNGQDPGWRGRRMIDMTRATAAIEAVQREAPELSADVARNVAFAVMRAVGVAVPRELLSRPVAVAVELHAVG